MTFHAGMKVTPKRADTVWGEYKGSTVCLPDPCPSFGTVYTIAKVTMDVFMGFGPKGIQISGGEFLQLVELRSACSTCGVEVGFLASEFRPVKSADQGMSILRGLLNTFKPKVKERVPEKVR